MPKWRKKKPKGISAEQLDKVMHSQRVKAAVDAKAEAVQEYWKALVSPSEGVFDPGNPAQEHRSAPEYGDIADYQNSVKTTDISDENGFRDRIEPTDFKTKWIEFGTSHMPPYAPMAKTKARFRK